ncbi:MAG TPA: PaaI family thioesterase [Pyrinomonadaceae bacterium]|nr:PaaI family thioesterase [Pyrinomonadaceae bacterium]
MTKSKLTAAQVERISNALDSVPYAKLLGIRLAHIDSGTATLKMPVRKQLTQNHGVVHGGAMASLIDSATAFAIISLLEPQEKVTTVDLTISYLRPVTKGTLNCAATVVRSGRRLLVVSAEVFDDSQKLVATALSTYIKI